MEPREPVGDSCPQALLCPGSSVGPVCLCPIASLASSSSHCQNQQSPSTALPEDVTVPRTCCHFLTIAGCALLLPPALEQFQRDTGVTGRRWWMINLPVAGRRQGKGYLGSCSVDVFITERWAGRWGESLDTFSCL